MSSSAGTAPPAAVVDEQPADRGARQWTRTSPRKTETDDAEETQVVVEESAAEPEEDEQPIRARTGRHRLVRHRTGSSPKGEHYMRMVPSQPTMGGADKIEVSEFFWYGCPHCYSFEPTINKWVEGSTGWRPIRSHSRYVWNRVHELHARSLLHA